MSAKAEDYSELLEDGAEDPASSNTDAEIDLVLQRGGGDDEIHSSSKTFRGKKRYTVSGAGNLPTWFRRLSGSGAICLVVGTIVVVAIVVVFVTIAVVATLDSDKSSDHGVSGGAIKWSDVRLQSSVIPKSYDISISVDLVTFQVTGSVSIVCSVTSAVDYIALHVKDMDISPDGHSVTRDGEDLPHGVLYYKINDFFIFNMTQPLSPGEITLTMDFSYVLRDGLAGFYRSSYINAQGEIRYLATTQFEATDARRAFPCFDEPSLKASFIIQITHHSDYNAWSNMPRKSRSATDSKGFVTTKFETSLKMSSYLVAFIVSDFECIGESINSTSGQEVMVSSCVCV